MGPITLLNNWMIINWKGCSCGPTGGTIPAYAWRDRGKHGKISYSAQPFILEQFAEIVCFNTLIMHDNTISDKFKIQNSLCKFIEVCNKYTCPGQV